MVLHVDAALFNGISGELFPSPPGGGAWDKTLDESLWDYCKRFDICIEGAGILDSTLSLQRDLEVCIVCRDWKSLERLGNVDFGATIVFSPGSATILDATRMIRRTLVASRNLEKGQELTDEDIQAVDGGFGAGEDCSDAFIGRKAAYDISHGEALDFGKIK